MYAMSSTGPQPAEIKPPTELKGSVEFGRYVKSMRQAAGLTQTELGKFILKGQTSISDIESGERAVDLKDIQSLALGLRRPPSEVAEKAGYSINPTDIDGGDRIILPNGGWYIRPKHVKKDDPIDRMLTAFVSESEK